MTKEHSWLLFGMMLIITHENAITMAKDWRTEAKENANNFSQTVEKFVETVLGVKNLQVSLLTMCPEVVSRNSTFCPSLMKNPSTFHVSIAGS